MSNRWNEKSIYFHLDPRLVGDVKELHLYALLEEGERTSPPPPVLRGLSSTPPTSLTSQSTLRSAFANLFCQPVEGTPPIVKVRAAGSGPGSICVIGRGIHNSTGLPPLQVYGKVYPHGPSPPVIPNDPPADKQAGTVVNSPSPIFDCPEGCGGCTYVFHQDFDGELTGVPHSTGAPYPRSTVAIWLQRGLAISPPFTQDVFGQTSNTSECGGSRELSPRFVSTPAEETLGPDRYDVRGLPLLLGQAALALPLFRQKPVGHSSEPVWKSCPQTSPLIECQLWITRQAGQPVGLLALKSVLGSKQESPAIWCGPNWQLDEPNTLHFESPTELAAAVPPITIVPA